ncbi:DUF1569 domain-containing protein [Ascidiimonas aurantiaca]|uniref:DUF1569 domain-containing protein n=1 Tax=Ascidiimonas aurantiaca TaxID=1685432 RepID=UPI0030EE08B5
MKSLFEDTDIQEIKNRIDTLSENSTPSWGEMTVSQMLAHCQVPLRISLGDRVFTSKISGFKKFMFSLFKKTLYNDKPWKKNLPTAKELKISDAKDFAEEKAKLLELIELFHQQRTKTDWPVHSVFGKFTPEQWGKMQYKHLDHHLTQFNT